MNFRPVEFEASVSGVIELAAKDFDGSTLAVQVKDHKGEKFLVDDTSLGEKLLPYIGSYVNVKGLIRKEESENILKVLSYSIGV